MKRSKPSSARMLLLILLLALGPLQAQALFACDMMDAVVHTTCCCDEAQPWVESSCAPELKSRQEPCCDVSVALSIDEDAEPITSVEVRSDMDPPQTLAAPIEIPAVVPALASLALVRPVEITGHSGTQTFLITQRLRI